MERSPGRRARRPWTSSSTCGTARAAARKGWCTTSFIDTTGDGSIAIQVSRPLGSLTVSGDVTTSGGEGLSLVKGVQMTISRLHVAAAHGAPVVTG